MTNKDGSTEMENVNWDYSSSILPVKPFVGGSDRVIDLRVREKVRVDVRTLDGLLKAVGWNEPIDLLKIDVQGAELLVLNGASDCTNRTRLHLTQLIPAHRLTEAYLLRLVEGMAFSAAILTSLRGSPPKPRTRVDRLRESIRVLKMTAQSRRFRSAEMRGRDAACRLLSAAEPALNSLPNSRLK